MTEAASPAPAAAPEAPVNGGRPTFNHPAIPPPKGVPREAMRSPLIPELPQAKPETSSQRPEGAEKDLEPLETKPEAESEPESDEPEQVEYFPDDEFVVTVDGKEQTVTMAKLLAVYQRNEASNARFTEAKALKNEAIGLVHKAMTPGGFIEVAKQLGKDPYEIAETLILDRYNYERMSPQEREMADYKRDKEAWDKQKAAETQTAEQRKQEAEATRFQTHFLEVGAATMDRLRVPADPGLRNELIARAAGIYRADRNAGYESTPQTAMQDAWDDYQKRLESHARALPVERRLSEAERATIAQRNATERVRVAQQAPKSPTTPARDDSGKFVQAQKPRMDAWNPMPTKR